MAVSDLTKLALNCTEVLEAASVQRGQLLQCFSCWLCGFQV